MPTVWSDAHNVAVVHSVTDNHSHSGQTSSECTASYDFRVFRAVIRVWVAALVFICAESLLLGEEIESLDQRYSIDTESSHFYNL